MYPAAEKISTIAIFYAIMFFCNLATSAADSPLVVVHRVVLPEVVGGFDLMSLDPITHQLFLAAQDQGSIEVIDVTNGRHIRTIPNFNQPKWTAYRPESGKLYIAEGRSGAVQILDSANFKRIGLVQFSEKANNLRFNAMTGEMLVGVGKTHGAIGIFDTYTSTVVGNIALPGVPKQFEIDGDRILVNIPTINQVAVVSRSHQSVLATWSIGSDHANVPMALDRIHRRLLLGCESGHFLVMDAEDGHLICSVDIPAEPDGVWYDARRGKIYVSCGAGEVVIITQIDADHYQRSGSLMTAPGAATSLFDVMSDRLFVAVPQQQQQQAVLLICQPR